MLVLTRKVGQTIVVDDTIRITVVAVHGDKVRLGIVAPANVIVDRQEIHEKRTLAFPGPAATATPAVLAP